MATFSEREGGEESGTVSTVSDCCFKLAFLTTPYIVMGGQSFHHLGGRRGRQAFIIRPGLYLKSLFKYAKSSVFKVTLLDSSNSFSMIHLKTYLNTHACLE